MNGDTTKLCHISNKVSAVHLGKFGDYMCDSPYSLVKNAVQNAAKTIPNPDYIFWTGDNVPHIDDYDFNYVINSINVTTTEIRRAFPFTEKILPLFGNHDYAPSNAFPDKNNTIYSSVYGIWKDWIGLDNEDTFLRGGYYKIVIDDNTTVLGLNTNLYYQFNTAKMDDVVDPAGQFKFMEDEFIKARNSHKFVHVLAHIPPGAFERTPNFTWMTPDYNQHFIDITVKYSDVIKWMIFGHHHTDTFRLLKDANGITRQAMFMAPAVTPWFSDLAGAGSNNPAFRVFNASESWEINDIETYSVNLEELNKNKETAWSLEYSFVKDYNLPSPITIKSVNDLYEKIKSNDDFFKKYLEYNSVGWNVTTPKPSFRCGQLCSIEFADYDRYYKCLSNKECIDKTAIAGASSGISTVISNNNNQPSSSDTVGPAGSNQWHNYPNYKPISWDRYVSEINEKPSNVSSGVAASITIFVFFAVFILTFGCRLYSSRIEESQQQQANATRTSIGSTSGLAPFEQAWIHPDKRELPPCYEVAITMPTQIPHLETSNSNCDAINCAADRDALALRLTYSLGRPPPASPTGSNSDLSNNSTNNNNSQ
uniref:Metallophos domain-containing protein n=1 Tax=Rhabditophanes sp. KR3021 TaxID=114890 RepID=A0AC35THM5_9BILA